jgi:hypothetical protein
MYLLVLLFITTAQALTAYDCTGRGLNITTLSLIDIGDCEIDDIEPIEESVHLQLLQLAEFDKTQVKQCKVLVDRTVYYCGMHSHVSVVQGGKKIYMYELGEEACTRLHTTGTLFIGNNMVNRLKVNETSFHSVTMAGRIQMDGKCSGVEYSDRYGSWSSVVVQGSIKVVLRSFETAVRRSTNTVILPSGVYSVQRTSRQAYAQK